ncbi:MAG: hypothetical protein RJQ07_02775 [Pseudomonadales bacterium]
MFDQTLPEKLFNTVTANFGYIALTVLVIYATGTLIEMLGDFFLARAASGFLFVLRSVNPYAMPFWRPVEWQKSYIDRGLWGIAEYIVNMILLVPAAAYFTFMGLLGSSYFRIRDTTLLENLHPMVREGVEQPLGKFADGALYNLVKSLPDEESRKWGRSLLNRAKDISVVTASILVTAPILVILYSGNADTLRLAKLELEQVIKDEHIKSCKEQIPGVVLAQAIEYQIEDLMSDCKYMPPSAREVYKNAQAMRFALESTGHTITWNDGQLLVSGTAWIDPSRNTTSGFNPSNQETRTEADPSGELYSGLKALSALMQGVDRVLEKEAKVADLESRAAFATGTFALLLAVALLALYVGYFASLESAVLSILSFQKE